MKPEKPIHGEDQRHYIDEYNHLVGRHNVLCSIERVFNENKTASVYFEEAMAEVLDTGNQSLSSMFIIAIENMARDAAENIESDCINSEIYKLQSENRQLRQALEAITDIFLGNKQSLQILTEKVKNLCMEVNK